MLIQKLGLGIAVIALAAWAVPAPLAAAAFDPRYDSKEDLKGQYEAMASQKMSRGMSNILFGWTEIGRTPAKMAAGIDHGALTAFLLGVPYGVLRGATRTVVGCYETATFFAPQSPIMANLEGDVV